MYSLSYEQCISIYLRSIGSFLLFYAKVSSLVVNAFFATHKINAWHIILSLCYHIVNQLFSLLSIIHN